MASRAERAINMALRVTGIGEVERDFRRLGQAGEKGFAQVEKSANGADRAMSEYTARLKRTADMAKQVFDRTPEVKAARMADPAGYAPARNNFVLEQIEAEKLRIRDGLPELSEGFDGMGGAVDGAGASLARFAPLAAAAAGGIALLKVGVYDSLEAFMEHEQALSGFRAELALAGNRSGATASQIEAMAERIANSTHQTEQATLDAARELAKVPGITAEAMDGALEAAANFADVAGRDVADVVAKEVVPVFQALATKDMPALIKATEGLDDATANAIVQMAAAGDAAGAQETLIRHLTAAVGGGEGSLTSATKDMSDAWDQFKLTLGENIAGPVSAMLNTISKYLENVQAQTEATRFTWSQWMRDVAAFAYSPLGSFAMRGDRPFGRERVESPGNNRNDAKANSGSIRGGLQAISNAAAAQERQRLVQLYGSPNKPSGGGGGGGGHGGGASNAQREAERLQREADQARNAADRVAEANEKAIESYRRRAEEAQGRIGLEGDALAAFERQLAIEEAARRINADAIEKEVDARRALAKSKGEQFDEAAATRDATAAVEAQRNEIRRLAADYVDANAEIEEFNRKQQRAAVILEQLKSPLEDINDEIERAIEALQSGKLAPAQFDSYMDILAQDLARYRYSIDETAQAWRGFGHDVGETLSDFVLRGGSALDVLQRLIQLPLERLLEQNLTNPVANWIDGLTGNNMDKNIAAARGDLPHAADFAGAQVQVLGTSAMRAATSLNGIPAALDNPLGSLTSETDAAAEALGGLVPVTGQFSGALAQGLAMLSGGGGSPLGAILNIGAGLAGGWSPSSALTADVAGTIAAYPHLFASGTDRVPMGRPFYVGENGRELMELTSAGLKVHSHQQTRRRELAAAGPTIINNTINIPQRADPRRTASTVSRATQRSLAMSARKGIAG